MKRFVPVLKAGLFLALAVCLALAAQDKRERRAAIKSYEAVRTVVHPEPAEKPRKPLADGQDPAVSSQGEETNPLADLLQLDLAALQEVNPDVVGWIEIPGTELSYPFLLGRDNVYYLNRTWDKKRSPAGAVFMDCTSDPEMNRFHTIIYGHRMNDGTMFGTLKKYKDPDFWQEHPSVYVALADGVYRYDLFSAQEADIKGVVYRLDIEESGLEEEFIQYCQDNAVINTLIAPTAEDRILTLSTCTGHGHATRWVVHGVLAQIYER